MIAFGPVPSRRLGRSIGINNIPPKVCSYSCVYCQLGDAIKMQAKREQFYDPQEIIRTVKEKIHEILSKGEKIDYLTFVPDGEPTLDISLKFLIDELKSLGIKIAVITNSSLIYREDVREALKGADWVSCKVDTVSEKVWRRIDHPVRSLKLSDILTGIGDLKKSFTGKLVSETMLVRNLNDSEDELRKTARFLRSINFDISYISVPTRPPAKAFVEAPEEHAINMAFNIFSENLKKTELLIGYEGNEFSASGNTEEDLLSITSVHPMRTDAVQELLKKNGSSWDIVEKLLKEKVILELTYNGNTYYLRKLKN